MQVRITKLIVAIFTVTHYKQCPKTWFSWQTQKVLHVGFIRAWFIVNLGPTPLSWGTGGRKPGELPL